MHEIKISVKKITEEEQVMQIGDTIEAKKESCKIYGKLTHIFDGGRRMILEDKFIIYTSEITGVNGINIKIPDDEVKAEYLGINRKYFELYKCCGCDGSIVRESRYCPHCGKKIKWEV